MKKESELDITSRNKLLQREKHIKGSLNYDKEEEVNSETKIMKVENKLKLKETSEPERWETTSTHWEKLRNSGQCELKSLQ